MAACPNTGAVATIAALNGASRDGSYAHLLTGENVVVNEDDVQDRAREVSERCADAYSANRYVSWQSVAAALLRRGLTGLTEAQAESVMRSKLTRLAADDSSNTRYGNANSADLVRCLRRWGAQYLPELFEEDGVL